MEPLETSSALYEALRSKAEMNYSYRRHGAVVVSVGLQLNQTLLSLTLYCSSIGAAGAAAIAEAL
jgi:hypothetical protein